MIRFLTEERGLNLAGVRLLLEIQAHSREELTWVFNALPHPEAQGASPDGVQAMRDTETNRRRRPGGRGR
jgi:hypothetical protein